MKVGITPCWICGFPIQKTPGLTYECEHVLPIAQAIFFLTLYSPNLQRRMKGKEREFLHFRSAAADMQSQWVTWNKEALRLEYDYAHQYCNQIKSDTSFITHDNDGGNIVPDMDKITEYLSSLIKSNKTRVGHNEFVTFMRSVAGGAKKWLEERKKIMYKRYADIAALITHGERDVSNMILLAGLVNVLDKENIQENFTALLKDSRVVITLVEHIRINEFAMRSHWKELVKVIANGIYRRFRKSIDFEPDFWKLMLKQMQFHFEGYEVTGGQETLDKYDKDDVAKLMLALPALIEHETLIPPEEDFVIDENMGESQSTSDNGSYAMDISRDDSELQKSVHDMIYIVVDYFAYVYYEKIYNFEYRQHTRPGIPSYSEPIAIETVYLYTMGYLLDTAIMMEKHRERAISRIMFDKRSVIILDYLRKNFTVTLTTLTKDKRITNAETKKIILDGLKMFPNVEEDMGKTQTGRTRLRGGGEGPDSMTTRKHRRGERGARNDKRGERGARNDKRMGELRHSRKTRKLDY